MFESNLVISRSSSSFKGYQHSFPDYLKSLSGQKLSGSGEVTVDLLNLAVDQLFPEVKQTWDMTVSFSCLVWRKVIVSLHLLVHGNLQKSWLIWWRNILEGLKVIKEEETAALVMMVM